MRKHILNRFSAAVAAFGVAVATVDASPVGMAQSGGRGWFGKSTSSTSTRTSELQARIARNDRPTEEISAVRHPVKYLTAAVSEMPIRSKSSRSNSNRAAKPATASSIPSVPSGPVGPPTPEFAISLAQLSESQGNVAAARHHYQRALAMWPEHVEVLRAAARMEDRQNQLSLAESLYRRAVASNSQHAGALNDLGLCLARQGRLEESVQTLERAIQLQPGKPLYRNNVATVLVEMHQDQRALAHLAAAHGSAEANYNLGELLVQRGRGKEATPYFIAAVEQRPDMQPAHDALADLQGSGTSGTPGIASSTPTDTTIAPAAGAHNAASVAGPTVTAPPAGPTNAPAESPQSTEVMGPQFSYPATARTPEPGVSSYMAPRYPAPAAAPYVPYGDPRIGARPVYLPPVNNQQVPRRQ